MSIEEYLLHIYVTDKAMSLQVARPEEEHNKVMTENESSHVAKRK